MSQPAELKTLADFSEALRQTDGVLMVVYFYAKWCGPCRAFGPRFDELAASTTSPTAAARFYKVDVDANEESADRYNVTAMPTVILFKDNGKVGFVVVRLDGIETTTTKSKIRLTHYTEARRGYRGRFQGDRGARR